MSFQSLSTKENEFIFELDVLLEKHKIDIEYFYMILYKCWSENAKKETDESLKSLYYSIANSLEKAAFDYYASTKMIKFNNYIMKLNIKLTDKQKYSAEKIIKLIESDFELVDFFSRIGSGTTTILSCIESYYKNKGTKS